MSWGVMAGHLGWGGIVGETWKKGPWTAEEDRLLIGYVRLHGEGKWNSVAKLSGLKRNGKSCRLRWVNYLRPDLKRGQITPHEERVILELHARWGNRWSTIARSLPGRTDNEIKNYWRTHFKKKTITFPGESRKLARNRILKNKQFHQHQQLLQQREQQLNQLDMIKIASLLDENYEAKPCHHIPQINITNEQENGFVYTMSASNSDASVSDQASNGDMVWDGLWNLEDFQGSFAMATTYASRKAASMLNFVAPFC